MTGHENSDPELITQIDILIGNAGNKLYGGSQYHRALREMYILAHVSQIMCEVTDEEVAQMSGISGVHDGPDYLRTVSKLALDKTFASFEVILNYFHQRCIYIMKRMFAAADHIVNQNESNSLIGDSSFQSYDARYAFIGSQKDDKTRILEVGMKSYIKEAYDKFVEKKADEAYQKCREDLVALTHFLSWDLMNGGQITNDQKSGKSESKEKLHAPLRHIERDLAAIVARGGGNDAEEFSSIPIDEGDLVGGVLSKGDEMYEGEFAHLYERSSQELVKHMLDVMNTRSPRVNGLMSRVMSSLIQKLTWGWRGDFSSCVSTKFNCFFMLSFHDEFGVFLREELERIYR